MENATSRFLGRPGSWHSHQLDMTEGDRAIAIKGTGQVSYREGQAEIRTGVIPIPQVQRLYGILVANDFVRLALDRRQVTATRISLHSGGGEVVTQIGTDDDPGFAAIAQELRALVSELFPPEPERKAGWLARLFGRG